MEHQLSLDVDLSRPMSFRFDATLRDGSQVVEWIGQAQGENRDQFMLRATATLHDFIRRHWNR